MTVLGCGEYECIWYEKFLGISFRKEFLANKYYVKEVFLLSERLSSPKQPHSGISFFPRHGREEESQTNMQETYQQLRKGHRVIEINGVEIDANTHERLFYQMLKESDRPIVLRLCDEKMKQLEKKLIKSCEYYSPKEPQEYRTDENITETLNQVQDLIWDSQLEEAAECLRGLSPGRNPLVSLHMAEIEFFSAFISGDSAFIEKAIQTTRFAILCADSLANLTSISFEKRLFAKIAYVEALALYAVLLFFKGNVMKASKKLRLCYLEYVNIDNLLRSSSLGNEDKVSVKSAVEICHRVNFGLGSFLVFSTLTPTAFQWVINAIGLKPNVEKGISLLRTTYSANNIRSRWAGLALSNAIPAVRIGQGRDNMVKLSIEIKRIKQACMKSNSNSILFLWSKGRSLMSKDLSKSIEVMTEALSACHNEKLRSRAYDLQFDIAWSLFFHHEWQLAASIFRTIYASKTSPILKKTQSALYLSACWISTKQHSFQDIRIVLSRCIELFETETLFTLESQERNIFDRAKKFVRCTSNIHLSLFPFEILYVHWRNSKLFNYNSHDIIGSEAINDENAFKALSELGTNANIPYSCKYIIDAVLEDKILGSPSSFLEYHATVPSDDRTWSLIFLAQWMTIRGLILRRMCCFSESSKLFAFVISLSHKLPSSTYTVPISLFRLAMDTFERRVGFDFTSTSIFLLETADALCKRSGGKGYDYDQQYSTRISCALRMIRRSKKQKDSLCFETDDEGLPSTQIRKRDFDSSSKSDGEISSMMRDLNLEMVPKKRFRLST